MKIFRLKFKNINSLKGEHEIDFRDDHFAQNPLFAITGPTGSGKTTILDVITLALFGEVPRLGKISKRSVEEHGAILTKGQKQAYAQVDYECNAGVFCSVWSIEVNRNGNLNDYEMDLTRLDQPESLDLTKSQIPGKNEELIGLNYSQFVKSVMLAQGEFAEFLKANRRDRSEILEKITGTSIYKELGRLAFEKFRDKNKSIEQKLHILQSEREKRLDPERRKEIESQLEQLTEQKTAEQKDLDKTKKQLEHLEEIEKLNQLIQKTTTSLKVKEKEQEDLQEKYGKKIKNHENVQKYTQNLQDWKFKSQEISALEKEGKEQIKEQTKIKNDQTDVFEKIKKFVGKDFQQDQTLKELDAFREEVGGLLKEKDKIGNDYREKRALFSAELKMMNVDLPANTIMEKPDLWKQILNKHEAEKTELQSYFKDNKPEDINKEIEEIQLQLEKLIKAQHGQDALQRIAQLTVQKENTYKKILEDLKPLPEKIEKLGSERKLISESLKGLRLQQEVNLMKAELETYRNKLKKGEPCPLCGSLDHVYTTHGPEIQTDLEKKIKLKEEELDNCSAEFSKQSALQEGLKKQKSALNDELIKSKKELEELKEVFENDYPGKINFTEEDWEIHLKQSQQNHQKLQELLVFERKNSAIQQAIPLHQEMSKLIKKGSKLQNKIAQKYSGKELEKDIRVFENQWQALDQQVNNFKQRIKESGEKLHLKKEELKEQEDWLKPELEKIGFFDIKSAVAALMPIDKYNLLKNRELNIEKEIKIIQTRIETHLQRREEFEKQTDTSKEMSEIVSAKENLENKIKELQEKETEKSRLIKNDNDLIKLISKLEAEIKKEEAHIFRWKLLRELIGDANGHKFNQFAQDLTLRQLLKLANQRLGEISDRYKLVLHPVSESGNDSLVIADMDMGGQERSVRTLSGGESFLVSLALALGLSDLASKNININSLFIDEGFGTLDEATLDQTLDVLERLQASSSKLIGIISHVESLKERIGTQIQLRQDGQGCSSMKIVSV